MGRVNHTGDNRRRQGLNGESTRPWDPAAMPGPGRTLSDPYGTLTLFSLMCKAKERGVEPRLCITRGMGSSYTLLQLAGHKRNAAELEPGPDKGIRMLLLEIHAKWPRTCRSGRDTYLTKMRRSLKALAIAQD